MDVQKRRMPRLEARDLVCAILMIGFFAAGSCVIAGWVETVSLAMSLLLYLVPAMVLGVYLVRRWQTIRLFRQKVTTIDATILDRHVSVDPDDRHIPHPEYHVIVQFRAGKRQVTLDAEVSEDLFRVLEPGEETRIRFTDTDPRVALLEGEDPPRKS